MAYRGWPFLSLPVAWQAWTRLLECGLQPPTMPSGPAPVYAAGRIMETRHGPLLAVLAALLLLRTRHVPLLPRDQAEQQHADDPDSGSASRPSVYAKWKQARRRRIEERRMRDLMTPLCVWGLLPCPPVETHLIQEYAHAREEDDRLGESPRRADLV